MQPAQQHYFDTFPIRRILGGALMNNCSIEFNCEMQHLTRIDSRIVAADSVGTIDARFTLSDMWKCFKVYARFRNGDAVYDVPLENGAAVIPWEVMKPTGFSVSLFGEDSEGRRLTSCAVFVPVDETIPFVGAEPIPATPSLLQRLENMVAACNETAAGVRADADAGVFDGAGFVIVRAFPSISDMQAYAGDDVPEGGYVVISSDTEDPDNAKLYQRVGGGWAFVVDMSGAAGADGQGVPSGGEAGQVLTKTAFGVGWSDMVRNWSELQEKPQEFTPADHTHGAGDVTSGTIPIDRGGTGASDAAAARSALGVAASIHTHAAGDVTSGTLSSSRLPIVPLTKGGTGSSTAAGALANIGAAAASHTHAAGDVTSGVLPLEFGGTGADSVEIVSAAATAASGWTASGNNTVRWGRLVNMRVYLNRTSSALATNSSWVQAATIPLELAPMYDQYLIAYATNGVFLQVKIGYDGKISIRGAIYPGSSAWYQLKTSDTIWICATYLSRTV